MKNNLSEFGNKLKSIRQERGLNANDILDRIDISQAYYSRLENGKVRPSADLIDRIASVLELPTEDVSLLKLLAGYSTAESTQRVVLKVDAQKTQILFSDVVFITEGEYGVVFDFGQKVGFSNELMIVGRLGVSIEHAKKIYDVLGKELAKAERRRNLGSVESQK